MALTIISSPPDYGEAYRYGGLVFKVTSDKDPAPLETATVNLIVKGEYSGWFTQQGAENDDLCVILGSPLGLKVGDYLNITATNKSYYIGAFRIAKVLSPTLVVIETPYAGDDWSGTAYFHRNNFTVVGKLYLGSAVSGSPIAEIEVTAKNDSDQYEFHVDKYLQKELSEYLSTSLSLDGTAVGNTISRDYIMTFHERYDVVNSLGIGIATDFDTGANDTTITSSALHVINAAPQAFHMRNRIFEGVITDTFEDSFLVNLTNTDARFLTNMPKRVRIGHGAADEQQESYLLTALVKGGLAAGTYRRRVVSYDADGSVITSSNVNFTKPTNDGVLVWNAGPKGIGIITIPTNTSYYTFVLQKDGADITETITFDCDYNCRPGARRFAWLNAQGGIDQFTFRGDETLGNIGGKTLSEGILSSSPAITDRQVNVNTSTSEDVFTSGSGIVNKEEAEWNRELAKSPQVWVFVHEDWGFNYIPVTIEGHDFGVWNTRQSTTSFSLSWRLAVKPRTQRA